MQTFLSVRGVIHGIPFRLQPFEDKGGNLGVIFNEE
jgi:hypothetical protein